MLPTAQRVPVDARCPEVLGPFLRELFSEVLPEGSYAIQPAAATPGVLAIYCVLPQAPVPAEVWLSPFLAFYDARSDVLLLDATLALSAGDESLFATLQGSNRELVLSLLHALAHRMLHKDQARGFDAPVGGGAQESAWADEEQADELTVAALATGLSPLEDTAELDARPLLRLFEHFITRSAELSPELPMDFTPRMMESLRHAEALARWASQLEGIPQEQARELAQMARRSTQARELLAQRLEFRLIAPRGQRLNHLDPCGGALLFSTTEEHVGGMFSYPVQRLSVFELQLAAPRAPPGAVLRIGSEALRAKSPSGLKLEARSHLVCDGEALFILNGLKRMNDDENVLYEREGHFRLAGGKLEARKELVAAAHASSLALLAEGSVVYTDFVLSKSRNPSAIRISRLLLEGLRTEQVREVKREELVTRPLQFVSHVIPRARDALFLTVDSARTIEVKRVPYDGGTPQLVLSTSLEAFPAAARQLGLIVTAFSEDPIGFRFLATALSPATEPPGPSPCDLEVVPSLLELSAWLGGVGAAVASTPVPFSDIVTQTGSLEATGSFMDLKTCRLVVGTQGDRDAYVFSFQRSNPPLSP